MAIFTTAAVLTACLLDFRAPDDYPVDVSAEELGAPVFRVENGRVIVEAETLVGDGFGKEWRVSKSEAYFAEGEPPTGGSFVVASVDRQGGAMLSVDQHARVKPLGSKEGWLQLRFYVGPGEEGTYSFGWRQAHVKHDGDNDVFPAALGIDVKEVARGGWGPTRRFNWYTNGVTLEAKRPGVFGFVLISRSRGYAVDRLVAWRGKGRVVPAELQDRPESPRWLAVEGMPEIAGLVQARAFGRAWSRLRSAKEGSEGALARVALEAHVTGRYEELVELKETDPAKAVEDLGRCARLYRGIPQAREMGDAAREWARDPEIRKAVAARRILGEFTKRHTELLRALKGRRVDDPQVQRQVARRIAPVLSLYRTLKRYGESASLEKARVALADAGFDEKLLAP